MARKDPSCCWPCRSLRISSFFPWFLLVEMSCMLNNKKPSKAKDSHVEDSKRKILRIWWSFSWAKSNNCRSCSGCCLRSKQHWSVRRPWRNKGLSNVVRGSPCRFFFGIKYASSIANKTDLFIWYRGHPPMFPYWWTFSRGCVGCKRTILSIHHWHSPTLLGSEQSFGKTWSVFGMKLFWIWCLP